MTDLTTDYLGLRLRSPIVASPGPITGHLDRLGELCDHGVGAVVLPSLFQEQIESGTPSDADPTGLTGDSDAYLAMIEAARQRVDVPVIASLNGTTIGGWLRYARLLEDAGAEGIELNLYAIAADPEVGGPAIESEQLDLVSLIAKEVSVPVAVKISPYYTSVANFAVGLQDAGAAGIVMFNRFYLPDLDLQTFEVAPRISLSRSSELRLPLRWVAILREHLRISIAGSTGVHTGRDVAKLLLVGADVAMTTSALLHHGASRVGSITEELREWMREHDYRSVGAMRGAAARPHPDDPAAFERADYIGNITSYTNRFIGASTRRRPETEST